MTFIALVGVVLFSFELKTGLVIIGLVVLVIIQIMFILSRARVNRPSTPKPRVKTKPAAKSSRQGIKTVTSDKGINSELFSKFQKNLNLSNQSKRADQSEPNSDVILSISSKTKRKSAPSAPNTDTGQIPEKTPPAKAPPQTPVSDTPLSEDMPVEPLGSIFDDALEPLGQYENKTQPKEKDQPVAREPDQPTVEKTGAEPSENTSSANNEPIKSHEFLTSEDLSRSDQIVDDEANFIMNVVKNHMEKKDFQTCLASINQYIKDHPLKTLPSEQSIELLQARAECEYELKAFEQSVKTWQVLFKNFIPPDNPEYIELVEALVEKYRAANQPQFAVHFLFNSLNDYRKRQDFAKMDDIYHEIEAEYQGMEDWKRLIQTYENHLSIKKSLDDFDGQLDLLDQLGKLLYDQGDAEGSRKCYEQRLAIENQLSSR